MAGLVLHDVVIAHDSTDRCLVEDVPEHGWARLAENPAPAIAPET
jgi:hypothetical protein